VAEDHGGSFPGLVQPSTMVRGVQHDLHTVVLVPYTDLCSTGNFNGAMCAIGCHCQSPDRKSLVVTLHNSGEMLVIRPG